MFSLKVSDVIDKNKLVTASGEISVRDAAGLMAERGTGALLVVDGERLAGICTERDVVFRVVARDRDPGATRVADIMTPSPTTVSPSKSFGYALHLMHENGFRHLPVVEDGKIVGIVSARNALDPDLEEFEVESTRREQYRREGS